MAPAHASSVSHSVSRTIADAFAPLVHKLAWASPDSLRTCWGRVRVKLATEPGPPWPVVQSQCRKTTTHRPTRAPRWGASNAESRHRSAGTVAAGACRANSRCTTLRTGRCSTAQRREWATRSTRGRSTSPRALARLRRHIRCRGSGVRWSAFPRPRRRMLWTCTRCRTGLASPAPGRSARPSTRTRSSSRQTSRRPATNCPHRVARHRRLRQPGQRAFRRSDRTDECRLGRPRRVGRQRRGDDDPGQPCDRLQRPARREKRCAAADTARPRQWNIGDGRTSRSRRIRVATTSQRPT